ncbi:hypothetical protein Q7A53_05450 [Halobacillus rhizosphaerae]|uniref:hypothetical protein n=1 Tax=Halobacillus rhizosphaerae TaxID=3064889 RepID=UPI00398A78D3
MENFAQVANQLTASGLFLRVSGHHQNLTNQLLEKGYSIEKMTEIMEFVREYSSDQKLENDIVEVSFDQYFDSLKRMETMMDAVKGYQEMGELNMQISNEDFHLESEGASLGYEMDSEEGEREAK